MNFSIIAVEAFEKELKYLARKYPSVKNDVKELTQMLSRDPLMGTPLGKNCYKIRMAVRSKGRGKAGGARIITHVKFTAKYLYLLSIYDKSEAESISDADILKKLANLSDD